MGYLDNAGLARFYEGIKAKFLFKNSVVNNLTTTAAGKVLDARQGPVLNAAITEAAQWAKQGASAYTHSKTGTVHSFTGTGKLGHTVMTADYEESDTVKINGTAVTMIGSARELIQDSAVLFGLVDTTMYIYAAASPFVIPNGATALPLNDVQTWIECSGVKYTQVDSPSLAQTVSRQELMTTLVNSQNAMDYLVRSQGLQTAVLASTVARSALEMSMPWTNPIMTSDTQPSGEITCSSCFAVGYYDAWRAFNSNSSDGWVSEAADKTSPYIMYDFGTYVWVYAYDTYLSHGATGSGSSSYVIQVSLDGLNWRAISDTLVANVPIGTPAHFEGYSLSAGGYAKYVRVLKTAGTGYGSVHELKIRGKQQL